MPIVLLALPVAGIAFWEALVEHLRASGFDVRTCSEVCEHDYRASSRIARILTQLRIWLVFPLRLVLSMRRHSRDGALALLVPTSPPYLPCIATLAPGRSRTSVIHLVYDLYPDVLELDAGMDWRTQAACWWLRHCTRIALKRSQASVFLGARLAIEAQMRHGPARRAVVIPVGGDGREFPDVATGDPGAVTAVYIGNMGRGHDWMTVAEALHGRLPDRTKLAFYASGSSYRLLRMSLATAPPHNQVEFGDPLGRAAWMDAMSSAQIALITLKSGAGRVMLPSKVYSAMLAGQAILAICERDTDLADTVLEADAGWVVEPGDVGDLLAVLSAAEGDRALLATKRANAQRYAREHFDMQVISKRWLRLLEEVASPDEPAVKAGRAAG
jgi:glycosyltransferase involved in cell wall biosynthesis